MAAPYLLSSHVPLLTLALQLITEMTMAYVLAYMFQLAHVVEGVTMLKTEDADSGPGRVNLSWAES